VIERLAMLEQSFLSRPGLLRRQWEGLERLLDAILPANRFYAEKFRRARLVNEDLQSLDDLSLLPFTTKDELLEDQDRHPPYGTSLTYPLERYTRLHQTSGTQGQPLRWLDTPDSWQGLLDCWKTIFQVAGVTARDRLFFPFSFGPFLGFWTAFEAAQQLGCLCISGGGLTSKARLTMLLDNRATVLLCTPTYALHLAEVAEQTGLLLNDDNPNYQLRSIIVAGEPGGSIPGTRARIENVWHARVVDHSGLTEVGPMTVECPNAPGSLHVLEGDYVVEAIDPETRKPLTAGATGELVVTTLTRVASPVLRYRTGDLVRIDPQPCSCGLPFVRLEGGILGRTDDMISIRGNNFYPSALENVIRRFPEVVEYRVTVDCSSPLAELEIEVEPAGSVAADFSATVSQAIRDQLLFRSEVTLVPAGSLPRFEMKANRVRKK
jgi:phenylacetate-CoA ligase